jgi:hypothetical protein
VEIIHHKIRELGCCVKERSIAEYEQKGTDRAEYGTRLLENLSSQLGETGMDGVAPRSLRQYRQFYLAYQGIWQTPSAKSLQSLIPSSIWQALPAELPSDSAATGFRIIPKTSAQFGLPAAELIKKLSFSHFAELIGVADDTKRAFYEIECIWGNCSVLDQTVGGSR